MENAARAARCCQSAVRVGNPTGSDKPSPARAKAFAFIWPSPKSSFPNYFIISYESESCTITVAVFAVARLAQEKIQPLVRKMDESSTLDPSVVTELFNNGLMGIEVEGEYGGSESSFFTCMLVVEELSKIDPSVGAFCDIHQTLVNAPFRKHGTPEQKAKYLPRLAQNTVSKNSKFKNKSIDFFFLKYNFVNRSAASA